MVRATKYAQLVTTVNATNAMHILYPNVYLGASLAKNEYVAMMPPTERLKVNPLYRHDR